MVRQALHISPNSPQRLQLMGWSDCKCHSEWFTRFLYSADQSKIPWASDFSWGSLDPLLPSCLDSWMNVHQTFCTLSPLHMRNDHDLFILWLLCLCHHEFETCGFWEKYLSNFRPISMKTITLNSGDPQSFFMWSSHLAKTKICPICLILMSKVDNISSRLHYVYWHNQLTMGMLVKIY